MTSLPDYSFNGQIPQLGQYQINRPVRLDIVLYSILGITLAILIVAIVFISMFASCGVNCKASHNLSTVSKQNRVNSISRVNNSRQDKTKTTKLKR